MASTIKQTKEKPTRIMPRQTMASAARAARNAANRTQVATVGKRQSPHRSPPSPATSNIKTCIQRNSKSESRAEVKINRNFENEINITHSEPAPRIEKVYEDDEFAEITAGQLCDHDNDVEEITRSGTYQIINEDVNQSSTDINICGAISDNEENQFPQNGQPNRLDTPKSSLSRPQTPKHSSRPSTPAHPLQKNSGPDTKLNTQQPRSRPITPQYSGTSKPNTPQHAVQSRPETPQHAKNRLNTPQHATSRPNTPQHHTTPVRVRTPTSAIVPLQRPRTPQELVKYDGADLINAYDTKQKEFRRLKKELDLKQQATIEVFDVLRHIRERMHKEGAHVEDTQELVIFNIADWAADEVTQLCRDAIESSAVDKVSGVFDTIIPIDDCLIAEMESKALSVPTCFAELCLQAFTARQELIDWVKDLVDRNELTNSEAFDKIGQYNKQGLRLCETLRDTKTQADRTMDSLTVLSKKIFQERSVLIRVGESLVREVARLRQELEMHINTVKEAKDSDAAKHLEEIRRELEEERNAKTALKEKLTTTETQLRHNRIRVTKMDKQLREAEASIASLTGTVKSLEDQSRQREVNLEARARKLKESLKTGEVTSNQLAQQRIALQTEVNNLKQQLQSAKVEHKSEIEELNKKLKNTLATLEEKNVQLQNAKSENKDEIVELNKKLEDERSNALKEIEIRQNLEDILNKNENNIAELQAKLVELENNRPNSDLPTEREMDLWSELHATKDTLRIAEEEIITCKREKTRFLESLTKIAESEGKMGIQQKLAAELLSKEEIVNKLQTQIRESTKNIKLNEQKVAQYEQYVHDLQAHNRAVANCKEAPNGITYQDLQEEVMTLRMSVLEATHRNEELVEKLSEKDQQIEQQDKTSRAQARVIKVREELINMLKNKETEQSRELLELQQDLEHRMKVVEDVNKQIAAKANEIQELFSSLENKQQQIHRLEKIVLALEEQQRRSQAQRTRHEEKIARLEHELAAGGNRKERKYLFF